MKHSIKCRVCGELTSVNGQTQISRFVGTHKHNNQCAGITGENVDVDNTQDRIDLRIDKPELITGLQISSVRDYWRKIPGGI